MKRPIVLVDALNSVFRSHYAHVDLATEDSFPTGAIYGFLDILLTIQKHFLPNHPDIIICWEGDTGLGALGVPPPNQISWRKVLAKSIYKANRTPNEETARAISQIPKLCSILKTLGFLQVQVPQLEADDIIGIASAFLRHDKSAGQVNIWSGDQDYYQCLENGRVQVLHPKPGPKVVRIDERSLVQEWGIPVSDWAKLKALAGDSTDNYKAVKGIGPKTACKLVKAGVNPSLPLWSSQLASVQASHPELAQHWEKIHLCYRLARIPRSWSDPEIPVASRALMRATLKEIVLRRRRCMTEGALKQAFAELTKQLGELEMVSFLSLRSHFWHGVKVMK